MKNGVLALVVMGLMCTLIVPRTNVQAETPNAIYIIFDASGSMWGQLPDKSHKVVVAKSVLQDFVTQDFGEADLALRAYGHRRKGDCRDSELVVPFGPSAAAGEQVKAFASTLNPLGKTPISYSLRQALADFGDREGEIILITDGVETCDEDPCALVRQWREQGVKINVHVVGFGLAAKEKALLQCISEAAGTEYHDAESALDLAMGLNRIHETTGIFGRKEPTVEPGDLDTHRTVGFWLQGIDPEGNPIRVEGTLLQDGADRFAVSSNARSEVEPGTYQLVSGVRTANGNIYQPITQTVTTSDTEDTVVKVKVPVPPSVKAKFTHDDEEQRGAHIRAYQSGTEVFSFRWFDQVYVDEGTYEFKAKPNADNDLSVTETLTAGDHKELLFEMVKTVRVLLRMVTADEGVKLRGNYELWQGGEKKYGVHMSNGATILPGTYDIRLDNDLNPHVEPGVVVSFDEDTQLIEIPVAVGYVTFIYQKLDGSRDEDKRVFLGRGPDRRGHVIRSGEPHALLPGTYNAVGWRGVYDKQVFEIAAGQEKEIVLRNQQ